MINGYRIGVGRSWVGRSLGSHVALVEFADVCVVRMLEVFDVRIFFYMCAMDEKLLRSPKITVMIAQDNCTKCGGLN